MKADPGEERSITVLKSICEHDKIVDIIRHLIKKSRELFVILNMPACNDKDVTSPL